MDTTGTNGGDLAALTDAQKLFIVQQLACFRTPTEVAEDLVEEFGIELARQRAHSAGSSRVGTSFFRWRKRVGSPAGDPTKRIRPLNHL